MTSQEPSLLPSSTKTTSRSSRACCVTVTSSACSGSRLSFSLYTGMTTEITAHSRGSGVRGQETGDRGQQSHVCRSMVARRRRVCLLRLVPCCLLSPVSCLLRVSPDEIQYAGE